MSKGKLGIGRLAIAFAALLTVFAVSGPVQADDNWQWNNGYHRDRDWGDDDGDGHHWRHGNNGWGNGGWNNNWRHRNDGWGNNWWHHDYYPRYVYVRPRPYYYPQPYYYDYYGRPSFNFVIPLHID